MDKLLVELIERRSEIAHVALANPSGRDSFEYGRVSGMYQGLTVAIEAVQAMLADKEDEER